MYFNCSEISICEEEIRIFPFDSSVSHIVLGLVDFQENVRWSIPIHRRYFVSK